MSLFEELKRRNVFKVAVAYIVTAWLLMQVADLVLENIGAPAWVMQTLLLFLAIGFPIAVIFAWAFEITPEGIKLEREVDRTASIAPVTGRKLDFAIIALLAVVAVYFIWESRFQARQTEPGLAVSDEISSAGAGNPTPAASYDDTSIAVLPFVNLSSDPEQEFFSDGISEELLNVLAQYPDLRVAARTSSFQFKGDNRDISEIANLLKVNHVLEGSVRKSGTQLRITAQLIEAENGYHLWSETYDRELEDVFAIQDEISAAIGAALRQKLKLDDEQGAQAPRVAESRNTAAYEAFLHGRHLINQRGNRAITEAVQYLEKSLRLDPDYAPAHAQLAIAYVLLSNSPSSYGDLTDIEVKTKATPHILRAEELKPDLPELWGAKAQMAGLHGRDAEALTFTARALDLNPVYIDALNWRYNIANSLGEYAIADEAISTLIEVDPYSIVGGLNFLISQLATTDPARAHAMAEDITQRSAWAGYTGHAVVASIQGELADALRWSLLAYREDPLDRYSNESLATTLSEVKLVNEALRVSDDTRSSALAAAGRYEESAEVAERELERDPGNIALRMWLGSIHYQVGNAAQALKVFDDAMAMQTRLLFINGSNSMEHSLRYAHLLREAGRVEESNAIIARAREVSAAKEGTSFAQTAVFHYNNAMLANIEGDSVKALAGLKESNLLGDLLYDYKEPIFENLYADTQHQELIASRNQALEKQHQQAMEIVCDKNPIPDAWQPLEQTCAGFESASR